MTQGEKQFLLKAICGYLPYGLVYHRNDGANIKLEEIDVVRWLFNYTDCPEERDIKPYLRSMSSMTEEEKMHFWCLNHNPNTGVDFMTHAPELIDWLNEKHFDYRGLIEKGLALEAPEGMYERF